MRLHDLASFMGLVPKSQSAIFTNHNAGSRAHANISGAVYVTLMDIEVRRLESHWGIFWRCTFNGAHRLVKLGPVYLCLSSFSLSNNPPRPISFPRPL